MEVKVELYEFLQNNETGMFVKNNELTAYVHVHFCDLDKFVEIVGSYPFDEGGMKVRMFEHTLAIDITDIIEDNDHELLAYRNCFDPSDIADYMPQLTARMATT